MTLLQLCSLVAVRRQQPGLHPRDRSRQSVTSNSNALECEQAFKNHDISEEGKRTKPNTHQKRNLKEKQRKGMKKKT